MCIPQWKAWHFPTGLLIYAVHSSMQSVAFAHGTTNICCAFLNAKRGICPRDYKYMLCIPQCKAWHLPTGLQIMLCIPQCKAWHFPTGLDLHVVHSSMQRVAFSHGTRSICCAFLNAKRGICPRNYKYMLCIPQCKAWHLPTGLQIMLCIPQCKAWHLPTGLQRYSKAVGKYLVAFVHLTTNSNVMHNRANTQYWVASVDMTTFVQYLMAVLYMTCIWSL
jgi:hypothetical protein